MVFKFGNQIIATNKKIINLSPFFNSRCLQILMVMLGSTLVRRRHFCKHAALKTFWTKVTTVSVTRQVMRHKCGIDSHVEPGCLLLDGKHGTLMGAIWWGTGGGTGGHVPPTFSTRGDIPYFTPPPHFTPRDMFKPKDVLM